MRPSIVPSYILSLWERIEVRVRRLVTLILAFSQEEKERVYSLYPAVGSGSTCKAFKNLVSML
jgi:hypothetical protein